MRKEQDTNQLLAQHERVLVHEDGAQVVDVHSETDRARGKRLRPW